MSNLYEIFIPGSPLRPGQTAVYYGVRMNGSPLRGIYPTMESVVRIFKRGIETSPGRAGDIVRIYDITGSEYQETTAGEFVVIYGGAEG